VIEFGRPEGGSPEGERRGAARGEGSGGGGWLSWVGKERVRVGGRGEEREGREDGETVEAGEDWEGVRGVCRRRREERRG